MRIEITPMMYVIAFFALIVVLLPSIAKVNRRVYDVGRRTNNQPQREAGPGHGCV